MQRVKTQDGSGVLASNIIIFCHLQTEIQLVEKQNDCTYYALVAPGSFSELLDHFHGTMLFIRHSTFSLAAISETSSNTFIDVYWYFKWTGFAGMKRSFRVGPRHCVASVVASRRSVKFMKPHLIVPNASRPGLVNRRVHLTLAAHSFDLSGFRAFPIDM